MKKLELFYEAKPFVITQEWGVENPVYEQFGFSRHNGRDVRLSTDNKLHAPFECEVTKIGWQPNGAGLYICLLSLNQYDWKDGKKTFVERAYMHLSRTIAKVGDKLSAGDDFAIADNTGFSTGPHTHIAAKRVYKKASGYVPVDKNDANGTFDDSSYYNGKYAADIKPALEAQLQKLLLLIKSLLGKK